ncbi:MAG: hypothetical protein QN168_15155 [Armatimonadota bacterium]|nr:hypothetical protein [Armatimonadota bacterium]
MGPDQVVILRVDGDRWAGPIEGRHLEPAQPASPEAQALGAEFPEGHDEVRQEGDGVADQDKTHDQRSP